MTKYEQIHADMITAMKKKDKERKTALAYIFGLLKNEEIEKGSALTDTDVDVIIAKQIKLTKAAMEITANDRPDWIKTNEFNLSVLQEYAPAQMDEHAIRHEVYAVCEELNLDINSLTGKDKGRIMGKLMPRIKGKADGGLVNKVVGEYCK